MVKKFPAEAPRVRRMSVTELIFGSPGQRRFTWGEKSMTEETGNKKTSVTEVSSGYKSE